MKIARVLKYNEAQSETTTVDINDNKIAAVSLQVLSWPSCLTDTPNSLLSDLLPSTYTCAHTSVCCPFAVLSPLLRSYPSVLA